MKIAVVSNDDKDKGFQYTRRICRQLAGCGGEVLVEKAHAAEVSEQNVRYLDEADLYAQAELIVVVGGDGAILHAAMHAVKRQIPILGVNTGRLGFMAGLEADELDRLPLLLNGGFELESRMMLEIETDARDEVFYALNDAVISKGDLSRIIDITVECNGREVGNYRADGIIVSTPTGSTAYSLSAGGPVVDPMLECIGITPICPHSLISRTVLFEPSSRLCIYPHKLEGKDAFLTVDGMTIIRLTSGERITISRSVRKTKLVKLKDISFYEVLNQKMNERGI